MCLKNSKIRISVFWGVSICWLCRSLASVHFQYPYLSGYLCPRLFLYNSKYSKKILTSVVIVYLWKYLSKNLNLNLYSLWESIKLTTFLPLLPPSISFLPNLPLTCLFGFCYGIKKNVQSWIVTFFFNVNKWSGILNTFKIFWKFKTYFSLIAKIDYETNKSSYFGGIVITRLSEIEQNASSTDSWINIFRKMLCGFTNIW